MMFQGVNVALCTIAFCGLEAGCAITPQATIESSPQAMSLMPANICWGYAWKYSQNLQQFTPLLASL